MELLIDKLKKIEALARSGVGGEKATAQRMLDALCEKHGITLDQIISPEKKPVRFPYKDELDMTLLCHIAMNICQTRKITNWKTRKGRAICFELTIAQAIDVEDAFRHYREAWRKQLKEFMSAFVNANRLFPPDEGDDDKPKQEPTPDSRARAMRIMQLMQGMSAAPWEGRKRIESTSDERS
jgi:hypothetical protein